MTVIVNPPKPATPRPPSRLLVWSAYASISAASTLALNILAIFFLRWGERMGPNENRLTLVTLLAGAASFILWTRYTRLRGLYEMARTNAETNRRLDDFEKHLRHLDESYQGLDARTQRLANRLEETVVIPASGEETGDLIRRSRRDRPLHLRGLKSS